MLPDALLRILPASGSSTRRPCLVIVLTPCRYECPGMSESPELVLVQAFVSKLAVERLDVGNCAGSTVSVMRRSTRGARSSAAWGFRRPDG